MTRIEILALVEEAARREDLEVLYQRSTTGMHTWRVHALGALVTVEVCPLLIF